MIKAGLLVEWDMHLAFGRFDVGARVDEDRLTLIAERVDAAIAASRLFGACRHRRADADREARQSDDAEKAGFDSLLVATRDRAIGVGRQNEARRLIDLVVFGTETQKVPGFQFLRILATLAGGSQHGGIQLSLHFDSRVVGNSDIKSAAGRN